MPLLGCTADDVVRADTEASGAVAPTSGDVGIAGFFTKAFGCVA